MKTFKIGLSILLYGALIYVITLFVPFSMPVTTLTILVVVGVLNLYSKWKGQPVASILFSLTTLYVIGTHAHSIESGLLSEFDHWMAEHAGISPGLTEKGIIVMAICLMLTLLAILVNALRRQNMEGQQGFLSRLLVWTGLPFATLSCLAITGHLRNAEEKVVVMTMLSYAERVETPVTPVEQIETAAPIAEEAKPEVANTTCGLPNELLKEIMFFENAPLASGKIKVSVINEDRLKKGVMQVGYCITNAEISEAIRLGYLPKGSQLPRRLTKAQADEWFARITVPTYLAQVKEVLNPKIKLTAVEYVGFLGFCHNLGKGNLKKLIDQPGRLNDGNWENTLKMVIKYNRASGKPVYGLTIRRKWELRQMMDSLIRRGIYRFDDFLG